MSNSSSGRRKKIQYHWVKTIEEANLIAKKYGLAQNVNFNGLGVVAANDILRQLIKTKNDFPDAVELDFVGSGREFNKYLNSIGLPIETKNVMEHTYGMCYNLRNLKFWKKRICLVFNEQYFNDRERPYTEYNIFRYSQQGWFPKGADSFNSIVDHEIGHAIDGKFNIAGKSKVIKDLYNKYHGKEESVKLPDGHTTIINPKMTKVLSSYANTNINEFIAEAWSEYRSSTKPREVAKQVGNEIIKHMKEAQNKSKTSWFKKWFRKGE